jgi:hypothetical protein
MREFWKNTAVRQRVRFVNEQGQLFDPDVVRFRAKRPDGTELVESYPGSSLISREAVGTYSLEHSLNQVGTWYLRVETDGPGKVAVEEGIKVRSLAWA